MSPWLFIAGFFIGYSLILTSFFYFHRHEFGKDPEDESEL